MTDKSTRRQVLFCVIAVAMCLALGMAVEFWRATRAAGGVQKELSDIGWTGSCKITGLTIQGTSTRGPTLCWHILHRGSCGRQKHLYLPVFKGAKDAWLEQSAYGPSPQ